MDSGADSARRGRAIARPLLLSMSRARHFGIGVLAQKSSAAVAGAGAVWEAAALAAAVVIAPVCWE